MASASSAAVGKGSQAKAPSRPRTTSLSPAKGDEELSASLSARLGDLVLTEKEASGLVIKDLGPGQIPKMKWVIVGKSCSPRKLVIGALERAMQIAEGMGALSAGTVQGDR
jgi:hypothetical protein